MVTRIERSVLLPHGVRHVFDVVANVGDYKLFLPHCVDSTVLEQVDSEVTASLVVKYGGFEDEIITRNLLTPYEGIELHLVKGPFKKFDGEWLFTDLQAGCRTELNLEFELASRVIQMVGNLLLKGIVDQVLDAFAGRARTLAQR